MKIVFGEDEEKLFQKIKSYAKNLEPPTVPRLAGGFVRDKIMGITSNDIDIAIDNRYGYEFAVGLSRYLDLDSTAHKIASNPERSKHLETAVLSIENFSIDFTNLRSEKYTNTRIPLIRIGTPVEDAYRRDLTINSLFYNLETNEIEDYTGKGLNDIENKILRTPLDPLITFLDDPLRVLRVIRFYAKLGFDIEENVQDSIRHRDVTRALKTKISGERVYMELKKMFQYKRWYLGVEKIIEYGYIDVLFRIENNIKVDKKFSTFFTESIKKVVESLEKNGQIVYDDGFSNLEKENRFSFYPSKCETREGSLNVMVSNEIIRMINKTLNKEVLFFYCMICNFIGAGIYNGKRNENINVKILRDRLKVPSCVFSFVKNIENGIISIRELEKTSMLEQILNYGDFYIELLIICGIKYMDKSYFDRVNEYIRSEFFQCHKKKGLVDGNDIVEMGVEKLEIKKFLRMARLYELENPNCKKEQIFEYIKNLL